MITSYKVRKIIYAQVYISEHELYIFVDLWR